MLLMHTTPDRRALTHWATRKRWLSPDGDLGYALHALLAEAFDGQAPTPFRYMNEQGLLAYSDAEEQAILQQLDSAKPEVRRILGMERLRLRPFPIEWPSGKRLSFEVRIRPIIRTKTGKERDIYQYCMEQLPDDRQGGAPSRETIYRDWLASKLAAGNGAKLVNASMQGFSLRQVVRRPQICSADNQRKPTGITGPDVLFRGELVIGAPSAFRELISRGIGRHRAFGFGMVLLRPAGG